MTPVTEPIDIDEEVPVSNDRDLVWALTPCSRPEPAIVRAATRAGALGILDLGTDRDGAIAAVATAASTAGASFGIRIGRAFEFGPEDVPSEVCTVVLPVDSLTSTWQNWRVERHESGAPARLIAEAHSSTDAERAVDFGVDGIVAKGAEAAGRVGTTGAFVLLQQILDVAEACPLGSMPVWVLGGIGVHTVGAAIVGGARGVVVDSQLSLLHEAHLPDDLRRAIAAMDGSETRVVDGHRLYYRPDLWIASVLEGGVHGDVDISSRLQGETLRGEVVVPIGQDGALAARFARRWHTVGRALDGLRRAIDHHVVSAHEQRPLAPTSDGGHGSHLPIFQGPMTRVSDSPEFAARVADAGAVPFLALALLSAPEVREMLEETQARIETRPWGVGILGFAPRELRDEQLAVIRELKPPVAIISGGQPSQAALLEAEGIATYLHAPSPGLLERYIRDGARRFIFEGFECGGHIGPRSSFVLWESQIEVLLEAGDLEGYHVFFAGGIHDARSAAMLAVLAAPLAARGATVGIVMGTAYLFTREAVETQAIGEVFQAEALTCSTTSVLESGPGHSTRCASTPFVDLFVSTRERLATEGRSSNEIWAELEGLNLGRLRVASKGLRREGDDIVAVEADEQRSDGLFMIGDVATLHRDHLTLSELHDQVTRDATLWVDSVASARTSASEPEPSPVDIAIVGMSAIMPGARDLEQFWANVVDGINTVTEVPAERWNVAHGYNPDYTHEAAARDPKAQSASKWGGFIPPVAFDALAYGIPPASLPATDPTQLLALKVSTDALEDAGYPLGDESVEFPRQRTAVVFASGGGTDQAVGYSLRCMLPSFVGDLPAALDEYLPVLTEDTFPGMLTSVIAGRVANRLDLGGKNLTVDAACASSLAAADVACAELANGNADMVLCGSADLHNGLHDYQLFTSTHALSTTGQSRTFDTRADGIALGEGVACVVLKRLSDAQRDGDRVYAVIRSVAGASDGRHLGLTAPRQEGQERALRRAYERAGIDPASVELVEAHGTGTVVGDRTELRALTAVFDNEANTGSITLGSVKSNIGHTKCSAGLAGLIKAAKAIYHGVRPPTLWLDDPNPGWDATTSPFHFLDESRPWTTPERIAGVSAFGFGGTNFHAVLSNAPGEVPVGTGRNHWPAELVVLRGTQDDVDRDLMKLLERLTAEQPLDSTTPFRLRDIAAATARGDGVVRLAFVAKDLDDLREKVAAAADGHKTLGVYRSNPEVETISPERVGFLFPGQGSQRPGMLHDLLVAFPHLGATLRAGQQWIDTILPSIAFDRSDAKAQRAALTDTRVAQPALALADVCMLRVLESIGLTPGAVGGHSFGELVALCAAKVFDTETLLQLASARADAILEATGDDPGAMAAVAGSRSRVAAILEDVEDVVIANDNHPQQVVLSGPTPAISEAIAACDANGLSAKRIEVACAFHSPVVASATEQLERVLRSMSWNDPAVPVYSNATAATYPGAPDDAKALLASQVAHEVRFTEQIRAMHANGVRVFVEVGPGRVLTPMVSRSLEGLDHIAVATDHPDVHGINALLDACAQLSTAGVDLDLNGLHRDRDSDPDRWDRTQPRARWTVNGHLIRMSETGQVVPGGLRPAHEMPRLHLSASEGATNAPTTAARTPNGSAIESQDEVPASTKPLPTSGEFRSHDQGDPHMSPTSSDSDGPRSRADEVILRYFDTVDRITYSNQEVLTRYLAGADSADAASTRLPIADSAPAALPAAPAPSNGSAAPGSAPSANGSASPSSIGELAHQPHATNGNGAAPTVDDTPAVDTAPAQPSSDIARVLGDPQGLLATLTEIVATRTGYPEDMLDPDMDIEADLSIDSIKRLEVLGELADTIGIDNDDLDELDDLMEELASKKTLRTIVAFLCDHSERIAPSPPGGGGADPPTGPGTSSQAPGSEHSTPRTTDESHAPALNGQDRGVAGRHSAAPIPPIARRYAVGVRRVDEPVLRSELDLPAIVSGSSGVADALMDQLDAQGARAKRLARMHDLEEIEDHVVILCDLLDEDPPTITALYERLRDLRNEDSAEIVIVSGLGGGLGVDPPADATDAEPVPPNAGVRALVKTFALEYPQNSYRLIDVDPSLEPAEIANQISEELTVVDPPIEVGRIGHDRIVLEFSEHVRVPRSLEDIDLSSLGIDREAVVLFTGGARGVTSSLAVALAHRTGCTIELLGRSPLPETHEPPELASCVDRKSLRRELATRGSLSPHEIETEIERILANREIRSTMRQLEETASEFTYHSVDVRDHEALSNLVDDIYRRRGRLDGIVHAAGVGINKLIEGKLADEFEAAFATKVDALGTLLGSIRKDLSLLVAFGSLVGPMGNRGQVDYAAANDALDTIMLANSSRARRTFVVDWGPWDPSTGMVSEQLARLLERSGMGMLDADDAVSCLLSDLVNTELNQEVIIRADPRVLDIEDAPGSEPEVAQPEIGTWPLEPVTFQRRLSLEELPETRDHCLIRQREGSSRLDDALPAVAMTRQLSLFAETARSYDLSRDVIAIEAVRNFRFLELFDPVDIEISVSPVSDDTLRIGFGENSKGKVVFGHRESSPRRSPRTMSEGHPATLQADELFSDHWLFHGPLFQGITDMGLVDDAGLQMTLEHLPTPGATLDNIGKAVAYWTLERRDWGQRALPIGVDSVRFYGSDPHVGQRLHLDVEITQSRQDRVRADAWITNETGDVWCEVRGWRTVVLHLDRQRDLNWRWPERRPDINLGPNGLHLWSDPTRSTTEREFAARRGLNGDDRRSYDALATVSQRSFLCERLAAAGTLAHHLIVGEGLEVFPNEYRFENLRDGLLVATCDRVPDVAWEIAVAAAHDVGYAVMAQRPDPATPLEHPPAVAIVEVDDDESPDDASIRAVAAVREHVDTEVVEAIVDTSTSAAGRHLAIAFTPTSCTATPLPMSEHHSDVTV